VQYTKKGSLFIGNTVGT